MARLIAERDHLARELFIARSLLSMWQHIAGPDFTQDEHWLREKVARYLALTSALDDPPMLPGD